MLLLPGRLLHVHHFLSFKKVKDHFQVLVPTRGEWNPPGLKGLLHLLSVISPLPLLPPPGPLLSRRGQEKYKRGKQGEMRGDRRSDSSVASPHPQNVQVKTIGPKTPDVTGIHRSLHLDTYGPPQSPVINSYTPQLTPETDSYGSPKSPLLNSYKPPVTIPEPYLNSSDGFRKGSVTDYYKAPKSATSYESQQGLVIDSYGYPKSPLINSYQQSSSANVSAVLPVTRKESPPPATPADSYGSPKSPIKSSYKKQPPAQETDSYGSPQAPLINTYQPSNQGSGSSGAHEDPLMNSFISVDLKATMPVSLAQQVDPHPEVFYGTPKMPSVDTDKLVNAHTALKDLVGSLGTNQPYNPETPGPQITPSISQTDLNLEVASPKYPAGYIDRTQGPKIYYGQPLQKSKHGAQPKGDRATQPSEPRPRKQHHKTKHMRGKFRPRKEAKKPPIKNRSKQRPRKLVHKGPKLRPPKLVKVYWNSANGIKSAKTKGRPNKNTKQRAKGKNPKKAGSYEPPPVIEPTMLGFHPLAPPPRSSLPPASKNSLPPASIGSSGPSVPTYPPEEFVW